MVADPAIAVNQEWQGKAEESKKQGPLKRV